jgi:hypothetical protein
MWMGSMRAPLGVETGPVGGVGAPVGVVPEQAKGGPLPVVDAGVAPAARGVLQGESKPGGTRHSLNLRPGGTLENVSHALGLDPAQHSRQATGEGPELGPGWSLWPAPRPTGCRRPRRSAVTSSGSRRCRAASPEMWMGSTRAPLGLGAGPVGGVGGPVGERRPAASGAGRRRAGSSWRVSGRIEARGDASLSESPPCRDSGKR